MTPEQSEHFPGSNPALRKTDTNVTWEDALFTPIPAPFLSKSGAIFAKPLARPICGQVWSCSLPGIPIRNFLPEFFFDRRSGTRR